MADDPLLDTLVIDLAGELSARGWMCATAESCTGGGVAAALTARAGSSGWFERGFVTYSNEAKHDMLGVAAETLRRHGAVSAETAAEMVQGALSRSGAQAAMAVTGIAGPAGGTADKPVGTVFFAWAVDGAETSVEQRHFQGNRAAVRAASIEHAIGGLLRRLRSE